MTFFPPVVSFVLLGEQYLCSLRPFPNISLSGTKRPLLD
jgi:hypothetical protein